MLHIVLDNLLSNAWKFTSTNAQTRIELGQQPAPVRPRGEGPGRGRAAGLRGTRGAAGHPLGEPAAQHRDVQIGGSSTAGRRRMVEQRDDIPDIGPHGVRGAAAVVKEIARPALDESAGNQTRAARLLELVEALPVAQREAFLLHEEGGLSVDEIAAASPAASRSLRAGRGASAAPAA